MYIFYLLPPASCHQVAAAENELRCLSAKGRCHDVTGQLDQQCQPASEQYNIQTEAYRTTLLDPCSNKQKLLKINREKKIIFFFFGLVWCVHCDF